MRCPTLVPFAVACLMACAPTVSHPHAAKSTASNAVPEPAIPAVLSAFDSYEVVAIPEGHGEPFGLVAQSVTRADQGHLARRLVAE